VTSRVLRDGCCGLKREWLLLKGAAAGARVLVLHLLLLPCACRTAPEAGKACLLAWRLAQQLLVVW
jgi:hypothetical protein